MPPARCLAVLVAVVATTAAVAPAAAQVAIRPEALPDLEHVLLTDAELDCPWQPGIQRARVGAVVRRDAADVEGRLGASAGGGSRVTITGAAGGTRETRPAYGALAMTGMLGLGPRKGFGVDLAMRGALERSVHDYRPSPMPMRPAGSHARRALDGEVWITRRNGDGGWAILPLALGIDDVELGLPGEPLGTAPLDHTRTRTIGAGLGYRGYHDRLADVTIAARIDAARTDLTTDGRRDTVDHLALVVRAEGLVASGTPMPLPLIRVPGTGLGFEVELGRAWLRHDTADTTAKMTVGTLAVVAAGTRGGIGGIAVSAQPSHTADGAHLARLWRFEARYGRCIGELCGDARAALSWLEPLSAPPGTPDTSEHHVSGRVTYGVHPLARFGVDVRLTHHGRWDTGYDPAVGVVVELGGYTGPNACK